MTPRKRLILWLAGKRPVVLNVTVPEGVIRDISSQADGLFAGLVIIDREPYQFEEVEHAD